MLTEDWLVLAAILMYYTPLCRRRECDQQVRARGGGESRRIATAIPVHDIRDFYKIQNVTVHGTW